MESIQLTRDLFPKNDFFDLEIALHILRILLVNNSKVPSEQGIRKILIEKKIKEKIKSKTKLLFSVYDFIAWIYDEFKS